MSTILLTGKNGQLGWELNRTLQTLGKVVAFDSNTLDLSDSEVLRKTIQDVKPDLIVNAAAYTAVDQAETNKDMAIKINAIAPEIIAEEAKTLGASLIHYSTDYVFAGDKTCAYVEDDITSPLSVYGESKLLGEQAIQATDIPYYIFRTSWVYTTRGKNFVLTMIRLMQELKELRIVNDQFGSPTWSRTIAEATSQILAQPNKIQEASGLYHLTSNGRTSWVDFAKTIYSIAPELKKITDLTISGIPTSEYPTPAKRPMNSELSTEKLSETFGLVLPDWEKALELCLSD